MKSTDVERIWLADIYRDGGSYGFCFDAKDGHWYEFFVQTRAFEPGPRSSSHHEPVIYREGPNDGEPVQRLTWEEAKSFIQALSFDGPRFAELAAIVQSEGRSNA